MKVSQFFEVRINEGRVDQYLELAAALKPSLEAMGGCLFIDRFKSLTKANLLLSYQVWRDESSLTAWRADAKHHSVQQIGREKVFADYRIRIAQLIYEQRPGGRPWRPERLTPYNDPSRRPPTFVLAAESRSGQLPASTAWAGDAFESVYRPGVFAHLLDVPSPDEAIAFGRQLFADSTTEYFRIFEVMRDYGMFDRREAPQYYPPVERGREEGS